MPRYTAAYSSFVSRLNEVESLRQMALVKEQQDAINNRHEINALCRGAIVLLSSHLEAYVKEVGEIAIESLFTKNVPRDNISSQFFYHISKDHIDEIKETADPEKIAEKVFIFIQSDNDYWSKLGVFPQSVKADRFNKGFSNPAFKKIKTYFNRFGYSGYHVDLARKLQAQFAPITNMVDHLVDTRNKIANGDPAASKTPSEVRQMIRMIKKFCSETDSVFAAWWKSQFCSIR